MENLNIPNELEKYLDLPLSGAKSAKACGSTTASLRKAVKAGKLSSEWDRRTNSQLYKVRDLLTAGFEILNVSVLVEAAEGSTPNAAIPKVSDVARLEKRIASLEEIVLSLKKEILAELRGLKKLS